MSHHDLAETWLPLRVAAESLKKNSAPAFSVARSLASVDGYDSLRSVEKQLGKLDALSLEARQLELDLDSAADLVREWLGEEWTRRASSVKEDLVAWFAERGRPLEARGELLFHAPLSIQVIGRKDRAEIRYAGELVKGNVPLSRERVFKAWDDARALLERRGTDVDDLQGELRGAYEDLCKLNGARARVRLSDLHFQVFVRRQKRSRSDPRRSRLTEYPRYQFAWDLAALLDYGVPADMEVTPAAPSAARGGAASVLVVRQGGAEEAYAYFKLLG